MKTPTPETAPTDVSQRLARDYDVWIIGDKYYEKAVSATNKRLKFHIPGGTWCVQGFMTQCSQANKHGYSLLTYVKPDTIEPDMYAGEHTFRAYLSRPDIPTLNVVRIERTKFTKLDRMDIDQEPICVAPKKLLVIEDMDMGYRTAGRCEWEPLLGLFTNPAAPVNSGVLQSRSPRIILLLGGRLPNFDDTSDKAVTENALWRTLVDKHNLDTAIVVNADLLRFTGANISRRLSWERTAQDLVNELKCNPRLQFLNAFAHLIIRFGVVAAVHCYRMGGDTHRMLYYDTKAHDGMFRRIHNEGGIIGNNSVFTSYIVGELVKPNVIGDPSVQIANAISLAIPASQRLYREGYPALKESTKHNWLLNWPPHPVFSEENISDEQATILATDKFSPTCKRFVRHAEIPVAVDDWSILKQSAAGASLMELARAIVYKGVIGSLNLPYTPSEDGVNQPHAPIARFGNFTAIDREEIESFRGVSKLIQAYLRSSDRKPLCVSVFGPPGSGKSVIVEEIAAELKHTPPLEVKVINMAQVTSMHDLSRRVSSLLKLGDQEVNLARVGTKKKRLDSEAEAVPFVFFDEFDCEFDGPLGWLKYFLGMMEDGTLGHVEDANPIRLDRCVLFFAGGTKKTYRDFSCEDPSLGDAERLQFGLAKGPDFISRLRGHINVKGVNRVNAADTLFPIRRGVVIRYCLDSCRLINHDEAMIDCGVLHAMLRINTFKHGARSIRALIAMCIPLNGRLEKASLPADNLLNMHVDSVEFGSLIEEYKPQKFDPEPEPQTYIMS